MQEHPREYYLQDSGRLEVVNRGDYIPSSLTLEEKVERALLVSEECIQPEELRTLFEKKNVPVCYDGFEPSGRMHIAQGIMKCINVNRLTSCGCVFVFWVADWFGMLNGKMGGDLNKIRKVGEYFIHVWRAAGMDLTNVRFIWTSEEINRDPDGYWIRVMDICRHNSISRMKRCGQIMGRAEGDDQPAAQILYPAMQCSDIFYIGADICQLGMDQRKVNILAREYADTYNKNYNKYQKQTKKSNDDNNDAASPQSAAQSNMYKYRLRKPVILSHHMLPGLLQGQAKMSKSDPDSAIFMEDSEDDVRRKIKKAYCPPGVVEENPCVSYVKLIVLPKLNRFVITSKAESEEREKVYDTYEKFEEDYLTGAIHPGDLKQALTNALNDILQPIRDHFVNDPEAKKLLEEIRSFKVTN